METEIAEQNKIIENMLNLGVDGMAIAPLNNKATRKPIEDVVAAGIPVVVFDSAVDGNAHISYVATDNKAGGALAAGGEAGRSIGLAEARTVQQQQSGQGQDGSGETDRHRHDDLRAVEEEPAEVLWPGARALSRVCPRKPFPSAPPA